MSKRRNQFPADATLTKHREYPIEMWVFERPSDEMPDRPVVVYGYNGNTRQPSLYARVESRDTVSSSRYVRNFWEIAVADQKRKAERRAERKARRFNEGVERVYEVGTIVSNSWGYEQTNIDFYVVTKRTAKFVTIVPIGTEIVEETGFMSYKVVPNPDVRHDDMAQRRAVIFHNGEEIGIKADHGWCEKWDGQPEMATSYE